MCPRETCFGRFPRVAPVASYDERADRPVAQANLGGGPALNWAGTALAEAGNVKVRAKIERFAFCGKFMDANLCARAAGGATGSADLKTPN